MTILEQRGLFWWHDEPVPDRQFVPNSCVGGLCKIEDDGRAVLELDGYLPNPHGPMASMSGEPVTKCIQGLLKGSNERILFSHLIRSGGRFSTNAMSFERFVAMHCLVGGAISAGGAQAPKFDALEIPLGGFEAWLRLGAIKVSNTDGKISARYEKPDDLMYSVDSETLSIVFNVEDDSSGMLGTHAFSLKESASLRLRLNRAYGLSDLSVQYVMLEDLLKLLTGSDYGFNWPWVSLADGTKCRWYFEKLKGKESTSPPEYYNTITNFLELRDEFGSIWSRWKAKREEFGPGFYLYLGTRRGVALYEEHRFVNLIWGLEAFHRKKSVASESGALAEKIERIIKQVACAKDRRWLSNKLKNAHEPALDQRLFDVFKVLPVGVDEKRLRDFSKACAKLRHDISHFGGQRHGKSYSEFIKDLGRKSAALSILYHALLLHEVGIDAAILKRWIYESFGSYPIKVHFVEAGLLDPSVLRGETSRICHN